MKRFLYLTLFFFLFCSFSKDLHPYHVGSVELNYQQKSKTFEGTARFFIDDVEKALSIRYGKPFHFYNEAFREKNDVAIKQYLTEYVQLKVNGKFLKINYIGYEEDKEAVMMYFESERVSTPKKVETAISLLYNLYDDQLNIVHIIIGGARKTERLSYPNRYLYQQF